MSPVNAYTPFLIMIAALLCVTAVCEGQTEKLKPEIGEYIDRKVAEYVNMKREECLQRAENEASRRVDSLLKRLARERSLDTFSRPEKPRRPVRPEIDFPRDTRPIHPFPDSPRLKRNKTGHSSQRDTMQN